MNYSAEQIIALLGLEPHPAEGGYFRETHRSKQSLPMTALPEGYGGARHASTAIYYLLTPDTISHMHKLRSDEVFHHYLGGATEQLQLFEDGSSRVVDLGPDLGSGQRPQVLVPAGVWQGMRMAPGGAFALLGCTVAPGRLVTIGAADAGV